MLPMCGPSPGRSFAVSIKRRLPSGIQRRSLTMSTTIKSLTAVLLTSAAATAPVASAMPASDPGSVGPQAVQLVQSPVADNGFDWGDAGIGAGGPLAVALLSLGGVPTFRRHAPGPTASPAT